MGFVVMALSHGRHFLLPRPSILVLINALSMISLQKMYAKYTPSLRACQECSGCYNACPYTSL